MANAKTFERCPTVIFFLLLAACLRIYGIGRDLLGVELESWVEFINRPWKEILWDYSLPNNHILNSLLANLSYRCFGQEEWAVRLPALAFGLCSIYLFYELSSLLFFNNSVRFLSTLLLVFSPAHIFVSQSCRGYSLLIFFTLLAYFAMYHVFFLGRRKLIYWICLWIGCTFSVLSVLSGAYAYAAIVIFCYLAVIGEKFNVAKLLPKQGCCSFKKDFSSILLATVLSLMLISAVYIPSFEGIMKNADRFGEHAHVASLFSKIFLNNLFLNGELGFILVFFVIGSIWLIAEETFLALFLLLPFVIPIILGLISNTEGPDRVYIFTYPFFIFVLFYGPDRILLKFHNPKFNFFLIFSLFLLIIIPPIKHLFVKYYPEENIYDLSLLRKYLSDTLGPNDLFIFAQPMNSQILFYGFDKVNQSINSIYENGKIKKIFLATNSNVPGKPITLDYFPLARAPQIGIRHEAMSWLNAPVKIAKEIGQIRIYELKIEEPRLIFPLAGHDINDFESEIQWIPANDNRGYVDFKISPRENAFGKSSFFNKMPLDMNGYNAYSSHLLKNYFDKKGLLLFFYSFKVEYNEKKLQLENSILKKSLPKKNMYWEATRTHIVDEIFLLEAEKPFQIKYGKALFSVMDYPGKGFFKGTGTNNIFGKWNIRVNIGQVEGGKETLYVFNYNGISLHRSYFDKLMVIYVPLSYER